MEKSLLLSFVALALAATTMAKWPSNMDDPCLSSPLTCQQPPLSSNVTSLFKSVMVVVAHPDDESCAGGTIAEFLKNGATVHFVWMTNGQAGTQDRSLNSVDVAYTRRKESINAANALNTRGQITTDFFNLEDGNLQNELAVRERLVFLYRKYRPELVLTWNPIPYFNLYAVGYEHHDHRTAGQVALDCAYPLARDFLYFPEHLEAGVEPWKVKEVWLFSWRYDKVEPASNIYVDIAPSIDVKIASLLQHKSQVGSPQEVAAHVKKTASALGNVVGLTYAEWFTRVVEMS